MRGVISLSLGVLLLLGTVQAPWLHVHESRDHEHPEHQHGLAAHLPDDHEHEVRHHPAPDAPWIDACDPGDHSTRVSLFTITLLEHTLPAADVTPAWQFALAASTSHRVTVLEVRVHGPPFRHALNPRPPPSSQPS